MSTVFGFGNLDASDESQRRVPPAGWSSWDAYALYASDPDGGLAPYRRADNAATFAYPPDTTPTYIEALSWEG